MDAQLLEMLFKGKKRNGEKVEHDDIMKGEAAIVEMLNGMKIPLWMIKQYEPTTYYQAENYDHTFGQGTGEAGEKTLAFG